MYAMKIFYLVITLISLRKTSLYSKNVGVKVVMRCFALAVEHY